ncbi:chloride intracellular channel protein 2-like [Sphaerodactylus townsendi]|uniref:chloride intracellular channel protein 2-like n=1 Tax=Sphaerodactylus townsendi TaxID=933632 RepID=UPI0020269BE4|nr:chloride intracellular channel protein 2-like [Sphaerodactylus townsendi]
MEVLHQPTERIDRDVENTDSPREEENSKDVVTKFTNAPSPPYLWTRVGIRDAQEHLYCCCCFFVSGERSDACSQAKRNTQPQRYSQLTPRHKESLHVSADIFAKFSAYIKNPHKEVNKNLEKALLREFKRLDDYLNSPLPEEIDQDSMEEVLVSSRKFLDGDWMTIADCNLLPKLNIIKVAAKMHLNFERDPTQEMTLASGIPQNAYMLDEFSHTCPADEEIERTYANVAKKMS